MIFVQNQKYLKDMYKTTISIESDRQKEIRAIAEANEFMYYQLKNAGLAKQIDENIGMEFLNIDLLME